MNIESRVNSSFKDTMSAMVGAIEKAVVDSENVMREWISDKHMSEEEKRQREAMISTEELRREREAREDREARRDKQQAQDQLNATLQVVMVSVLKGLVPNAASNSCGEQYSPHVNTQKSIQVYLLRENNDSEDFPSDIVFRNLEELKQQLCNFVGMKRMEDKDIRIVLDHSKIIRNTTEVVDQAIYDVEKHSASSGTTVKLYLR